MMQTLLQDIRYGWRLLAKSPGFTLVVVIMLALGIGANTAVFTVFNAALLRALPYEKPDELVQLWDTRTSGSFQQMEVSYPDYVDIRDHNQVFSSIGGYSQTSATLAGRDGAEQIRIAVASSGFFETLGVRPILGRTFEPAEDDAPTGPVLLTFGGWQRRFAGDPNILGKTVVLDGKVCPIAGVLPRSFHFGPSQSAEIWRSLQVPKSFHRRNLHWFHPVARLKPGVTLQQAQAGAQTLARQLELEYPDSNRGVGVRLIPLREDLIGQTRPILLLVMATVALVLLITCANIAGLLLARSVPRQREIAIRVALGAPHARIVRQLLTESLLLAFLGGVAGIGVAFSALPAIVSAIPKNELLSMPFLAGLSVDRTVLLFCLALSVLTGVLFGIIPALRSFKPDTRGSLQEAGRSTASVAHSRLRGGFVIAEIALAGMLLTGTGLLLKSLRHVLNVDPGFRADHLLTLSLALPDKTYPDDPHAQAFLRELLSKTNAAPGVDEAAAVTIVPLSGAGNTSRFDLEGRPKASGGEEYEANTRSVSSNYFHTMAIPLRAGRLFSSNDNDKSQHVVVVNQALADLVYPNQNPVGRRINFTYSNTPNLWQIIGVVGNENVGRLDANPTPVIYDSFDQDASTFFSLVVRTKQEPNSLVNPIRNLVREMDRDIPVFDVASMEQIIWDSPTMLLRAYPAYLVGIFSALALVLALLGVYGLLAYSVAQRTGELGLRVALGAAPHQLLKLVMTDGLKLSAVGAGLALVGGLAAARVVSSFLFGVTPTDLATFLQVIGVLLLCVLAATYIPARRATKIDPMVALRNE